MKNRERAAAAENKSPLSVVCLNRRVEEQGETEKEKEKTFQSVYSSTKERWIKAHR